MAILRYHIIYIIYYIPTYYELENLHAYIRTVFRKYECESSHDF